MNVQRAILEKLKRIDPRFLPFADAASAELPLGRLLRLALFQVSVGMASVLLLGRNGDFFGTIAYGENADAAIAKLRRLAKEG